MRLDVYVITDAGLVPGRGHLDIARAAIAGGAGVVQLRDKRAPARELYLLALAMARLCREAGVTFIVNDRVDVAIAAGADGVHLGVEDLPVDAARRLLGPGRLIGYSPASLDDARQARAAGADYLGVGSVFATATKGDAGEAIGPAGLAAVRAVTDLPIVAIGGITPANAPQAVAAGAAGVAVISAVVTAPDMAAATRKLALAVRRAKAAAGRPGRQPDARI